MNEDIIHFKKTGDRQRLYSFYQKKGYSDIYRKIKPKWKSKFEILVSLMKLSGKDRVLDIGCASKMLLPFIETTGASYFGADISPLFEPDFVTPAEELSGVPTQSFDWVVMSDILEHVSEPDEALKAALRVGKKLLVVVPNWYRLERFGKHLPRNLGDRHLHKNSPKTWLEIIEKSGWHVSKIQGFYYVPSIAFYPNKILNLADHFFRLPPFHWASYPFDHFLAGLPLIRFMGQELIVIATQKKGPQ